MKKLIGLCLLFAGIFLLTGCPNKPFGKRDADVIVKKYVKKEVKPQRPDCETYYFNKLEVNRIELVFFPEKDTIVAENAFVYYIDEMPMANLSHPIRLMIVSKYDGKYEVYHKEWIPEVSYNLYGSVWTLLK